MNFNSLQHQRGIALLAVLAVSLALSILIASATVMMQRQLSLAQTAKQLFEKKVLAYAKGQELTYLLATQRTTRAGVSRGTSADSVAKFDGKFNVLITGDELRVDGHTYEQIEDNTSITYRIQALNGLIPVNTANQFWLSKWLLSYGIDAFTVSKLADSLADYADPDDWARPAGAESYTYNRKGKDNPSQFLLQTCSELHRVLHWAEAIEQFNIDVNECSTSRSGIMNINAIPSPLITRLLPDDGARIHNNRNAKNWLMSNDIALASASSLNGIDDTLVTIISSNKFLIEVGDNEHIFHKFEIDIGTKHAAPFSTTLVD